MWQTTYEARLLDWNRLRQQAQLLFEYDQLMLVNDWWQQAPIVNRTITWDDPSKWPTPWQLLINSGYCSLARALGIVYTLMLINQDTSTNLEITNNGEDNLVLIDQGKYTLNWAPGEIVNTHSASLTVINSIHSTALTSFLT